MLKKHHKENYMTVPAAIRELEKIEIVRHIDRKRQTIRLPIIKRRFVSGVVSCIHLEALRTRASDHPVLRDLYFHFHHCASEVL